MSILKGEGTDGFLPLQAGKSLWSVWGHGVKGAISLYRETQVRVLELEFAFLTLSLL